MTRDHPQIQEAGIIATTNKLFVKWLTNVSDVVNIAVIARNIITGKEHSTVVEGSKNEALLTICNPTDTFNVTVIAFDNCQNFSSDTSVIDGKIIDSEVKPGTSTLLLHSTPTIHVSSSYHPPYSTSQCVNNGRKNLTNEGIY